MLCGPHNHSASPLGGTHWEVRLEAAEDKKGTVEGKATMYFQNKPGTCGDSGTIPRRVKVEFHGVGLGG